MYGIVARRASQGSRVVRFISEIHINKPINERAIVMLTKRHYIGRTLVKITYLIHGPELSCLPIGLDLHIIITNIISLEQFTVGSNSYENAKTFKYLGSLLTYQNSIHEKIKCRL